MKHDQIIVVVTEPSWALYAKLSVYWKSGTNDEHLNVTNLSREDFELYAVAGRKKRLIEIS